MYGSGFIIEGTRPNTRIGEIRRDAGSVSSRSLQSAWPASQELNAAGSLPTQAHADVSRHSPRPIDDLHSQFVAARAKILVP
jgi:hypothetical protein